jgi:hypothetical protein
MKKATLVLATAVAFLLSGTAFAARKVVDMPPTSTIFSGSTSAIAENGVLKVTGGALVGEYIPGVKNALAIIPETKIATSAITGLAKNVIKGGIGGLVVGAAIDGLIEGVGWIEGEGGQIQKPGTTSDPVATSPGQYRWVSTPDAQSFDANSAAEGCASIAKYLFPPRGVGLVDRIQNGGTSASCYWADPNNSSNIQYYSTSRVGNGCPANTSFSTTVGACISTGLPTPVTDSDLGVLDGFIKGKDGVWQRDLTSELCNGNENCYKALSPQTSLTGPSSVTGTPQTVTTTSPTGAVSTSVKTPTSTITYGPNYYDYTTSTTTTNNNGGDTTTTTDDTDTSFPVPPDIFGGANDGLGGIRDSIPTTASSTSPIPYMAWWSFSQSCNEITFIIPVYGAVTTALCPIYKQYIWPVLYFFFAVFTWLTCFEIWRKTVMRVRAS